jgi:DHA1 family multidrug resistance protein-like MFS transporter
MRSGARGRWRRTLNTPSASDHADEGNQMKRQLLILLACLFVVMIGFGITLPVLPFYVEQQSVVLHVTLLTGVYSLMQLIFAPLWGRRSDRIGRRPLLLVGIAGYVVAQVLFGLSTSLWLLYAARIAGGILSSATLPVSAAYVSDMTTIEERGRGMAWLGTAGSLGVVVGPGLGGLLSRVDWHFHWSGGHFKIDSFSAPFFAAALVGLLTLVAALRWLPESLPASLQNKPEPANDTSEQVKWRTLFKTLSPLLLLTLAGQFALTMFEGTFALFAQAKFDFGPVEVGYVFVVCGLVMTIFQGGAVGILAGRISEISQIGAGFALMGTGIALLAAAHTMVLVFPFVAMLALGMALIAPNLSALVSKRGGERQAGASLGMQNAVNSLGQAAGPVLGGVLFLWEANAPYLLSGASLIVVSIGIAWKAARKRSTSLSMQRTPRSS